MIRKLEAASCDFAALRHPDNELSGLPNLCSKKTLYV
jgi:hypothetical protein